jgi:hypothetical protein
MNYGYYHNNDHYIIIVIIIIIFFERAYYLSADFLYTKCIGHNLKASAAMSVIVGI